MCVCYRPPSCNLDEWLQKDSCRRKAKRTSCPRLWEKFRILRRSAKSLVRAKRTQYFHSLPSLLRSNSKKFWSVFKSTSKHSNIPGKMTWTRQDSSTTAETPIDIANLLNRYFYSVFKPSCDSTHGLPIPVDDDSINLTTIADLELTEGEVCSVLRTLDVDKATGPDKIPAVLLKNCAASVSPSLCELFNKSLSCGKLPRE